LAKKLRRKLLVSSLLILVIAGSIYYYRESILIVLGEYLITEYPLEKADAIAVLSGDVPARILEAIDIYKQGYAPIIILTMDEKPAGYDEMRSLGIKMPEGHDINQMIALKLGVPAASIIIIDKRVDSTYTEVTALYDFLKKRNLKSVVLVTSKYHTTRATKLFNFVTNGPIKLITRPSKYDTFDARHWWKVKRDVKQVLSEYEKLADYYFFIRMLAFFN
jgi:uncharacterized SAM-binding protein YcdF (DUF218 family)